MSRLVLSANLEIHRTRKEPGSYSVNAQFSEGSHWSVERLGAICKERSGWWYAESVGGDFLGRFSVLLDATDAFRPAAHEWVAALKRERLVKELRGE